MSDVRCCCEKLLCKLEGNVVLIKCKKCKRITSINIVNGDMQVLGFSPDCMKEIEQNLKP